VYDEAATAELREKYKDDDGLEMLFAIQKMFQRRLFNIDLPMELPERIPMTVTSIVAELGEVLECNQMWKDWKKNSDSPDMEHLTMELADLWIFVTNLTLYCGVDHDALREMLLAKAAENHARQDRDY
jgi:NTP pyrophosphatase (non-canonical NTP hydrolase)